MSSPSSPRFCMECGQSLPPQAKFCPGCGTKVPIEPEPAPVEAPLPPSPASSEPPLPAELRAKFESTRAELRGDRREVVVLFADVSGYTSMSEGMDPEEVSLVMQGLMRELAEAVYRYEGYVDKYIGDAIMALFGAPLAHENDAERAVLTALEMIEIIRRRQEAGGHPIALRVGLNLGEVVAAHMGSEMRLQYTVMGDTVNVASRLESAAEPNTVLASESVHERIAHKFETEEVPPLTVKGKSEPVRAHRILRYRASREPSRGAVTAFVGREKELAALEEYLSEVSAGRADTLLVEANAGAGKSRLIREALSRSGSQLRSIQVEFTQIELPGQLPVVAEILRQLGERVSPADPSNPSQLVEALREYLGEDAAEHEAGVLSLVGLIDPAHETRASAFELDPETARQGRWLALAALLARASREEPLVIVFEDVHWMGEEPGEFLAFLLPRLSTARVGVILTARPGTSGPWFPQQARRLTLDRLSELDARSILGDLFNELRPQERRDLIRRSEGNPLYLEELARSMRESLGAAATSVPGTLQGLLQSRIDRLSPPVQAALQMAAVLGSRFSAGLLSRMYQLEAQSMTSEEALQELEEKGFLEAGGGDTGEERRFRHPLMQEVAYGGLLMMVRKILHESAARLGEQFYSDRLDAEAPFFAHHYWRAGLKVEAAPHLWKAGLSSARNFELLTAEKYLSRFAGIVEEEPAVMDESTERAHFEEIYGKVLLERNELEAARTHFEKLRELGESEERTEWTAAGIMYTGHVALALGSIEEARDLFEKGMSFPLEEEDIQLVADLHNCLGNVYSSSDDATRALEEHRKALEIRERIGDQRGIAKSLLNMGFVFLELTGDLSRAEEHFRRALDLTREIGDRKLRSMALNNLGRVAIDKGEWHHALTRFRRLEELAEELGWPLLRYVSLRNQASCEVSLGHIDSALRSLRICTEQGDGVLVPSERFFVRSILFEAYLRALADSRAQAVLSEAEELLQEHGLEDLRDAFLILKGRWLAARREWEKAAAVLAEAAESAKRYEHAWDARLAEFLSYRASRRAGLAPEPPEHAARTPWESALLGYLRADADAADGGSPQLVEELGKTGEIAAGMGEVGLERAVFERLAELLGRSGDLEGQAAAAQRALKAMEALEQHLPEELRDGFVSHSRNAALREVGALSLQ